ncbi:hypothetical protein [Micromonospora sp. SL4-19]|uniref:hypothetical protein n=1 Tax=Micromonospora sp. SL4-19 TaxID=3399129 RepID=UPI003A4D237B
MLLRLAYLGLTNVVALLRLLPGSDRDKDAEILALRHQLAVLQRQWDAARDTDDDLQHLLPADVEWANRSRTALPNGHCGLPRQQTCDHSNKCLTCPVFITTSEDLPAHEAHRHRTLTLIAQLEARGQTKLADQNRLVLEQLDARIAQIKQAVAAGGAHRDAS